MAIERRIVTSAPPTTTFTASRDPLHTCRRTIKLDGRTYACKRETRAYDKQHDGIHDAFVRHSDGGLVRW